MRAVKNKTVPILEPYPPEYSGWIYLAVLQTSKSTFDVVIDNSDHQHYYWYNVGLLNDEQTSEAFFRSVTAWRTDKPDIPLSIYLSSKGLTDIFHHAYQHAIKCDIRRIMGTTFHYPMWDGTINYAGRYIPSRPKTKRIKRS